MSETEEAAKPGLTPIKAAKMLLRYEHLHPTTVRIVATAYLSQTERVKALEEALRYVEPFLAYAWQEGGVRLSRRAKECLEKVGAALQGTGT